MRTTFASMLALSLALAACGNKDKDKPAPEPKPAQPEPKPVTPTPGSAGSAGPGSSMMFTDNQPPPPKPTWPELQQKALSGIAAAFNAHDAKAYGALFAEHSTSVHVPDPDETGPDAIGTSVSGLFTEFPDLKFAIGRSWSYGNTVIAEWAWTGTDKASSRPAGEMGLAIAALGEDGKLDAMRLYFDDATIAAQLDPKAAAGSFRAPPTLPTASAPLVAGDTPDERALLETYKGLYQALDAKKKPAAMAFFTDDSVIDDYTAPAAAKGLKGAGGVFDSYVAAVPDFKQLPLTNQWVIGNFVISEGVLGGTEKSDKRKISEHFVDVIETHAGKIGHLETFGNAREMAPPAAKK